MLNETQVKRILAHCKRVDQGYSDSVPTGLQTEWATNIGWIQALRLVLHDSDKVVIRKDPMEEKECK